jgi:transcriptional regulator with XRE-family HTH domain
MTVITKDLLRVIRNAVGLTQDQFAEKLFISGEYYRKIENGTRDIPDPEHLIKNLIDCLRAHIKRCDSLILNLAAVKLGRSSGTN